MSTTSVMYLMSEICKQEYSKLSKDDTHSNQYFDTAHVSSW